MFIAYKLMHRNFNSRYFWYVYEKNLWSFAIQLFDGVYSHHRNFKQRWEWCMCKPNKIICSSLFTLIWNIVLRFTLIWKFLQSLRRKTRGRKWSYTTTNSKETYFTYVKYVEKRLAKKKTQGCEGELSWFRTKQLRPFSLCDLSD